MTQTTIRKVVEIDSPFLCPYHSRVGSIYICQHKNVKKDGYLKTCEKIDNKHLFPADCPLQDLVIEESDNKPTVNVREIIAEGHTGMGQLWNEEEDAILLQTGDRPTAIELYRKAYPLSERTDVAIQKRYNRVMRKLKQDNPYEWDRLHAQVRPNDKELQHKVELQKSIDDVFEDKEDWLFTETMTILTARNENEAIARYERHYFAGKTMSKHRRSKDEVGKKWQELNRNNEIIHVGDYCQINSSYMQGSRGTVSSISEDGLSVILNVFQMGEQFETSVPVTEIERIRV